jgi:hypothetical protein
MARETRMLPSRAENSYERPYEDNQLTGGKLIQTIEDDLCHLWISIAAPEDRQVSTAFSGVVEMPQMSPDSRNGLLNRMTRFQLR